MTMHGLSWPDAAPDEKNNYQSNLSAVPGVDTESYRYGFNGMEKDNELKGEANSYDFGARMHDPRVGRFLSLDPLAAKYPSLSDYAFVANSPLNSIDPDGRLILFINGLRLFHSDNDQDPRSGYSGFYKYDIFNYWSTDENSFGEKADLVSLFSQGISDNNILFTSGSSSWDSQAYERKEEGRKKAKLFHSKYLKGDIQLNKDETIKIVSHSQGGSHAAGFVEQLMKYKDKNGDPLYNIEIMYYITPHQPTDFTTPKGFPSIQYSHPNDAITTDAAPSWLINGNSKYGLIKGATEFHGDKIFGGENQPAAEGPSGNMGGHKATDNEKYIKETNSIRKRRDVPKK